MCVDVISSVQQVSELGPLLTLLFIHDHLNGLSSDAVMFVDDMKN